jgi:hypothetical protein
MKIWHRKILAGLAGVLFLIFAIIIAVIGHGAIAELAILLTPDNPIVPRFVKPGKTGDVYHLIYMLGLCVTSGFAVTYLLWERRPSYFRRRVVYIAFLMLILPMSMYNYFHFDIIIRPSAQAIINLLIIFLGTVLAVDTYKIEAIQLDAKVLKWLVLFLLLFFSVLIPGLFSLLWILEALHVISYRTVRSMDLNVVSVIAGVVSAIIAVLSYKKEGMNETKENG